MQAQNNPKPHVVHERLARTAAKALFNGAGKIEGNDLCFREAPDMAKMSP
ncbi:MAG: hypothetical protein HGB19_11105 [Chlorobiales bacterium]|nr:hypothetical protein [Chlorobiales bacterium]